MKWLSFADFNELVRTQSKHLNMRELVRTRSEHLNIRALDRAIEIVQEEVEHTDDQYSYALYCVYVALIN